MWQALAYGGFLVGSYIYHRLTAPQPPRPKPMERIEVPRLEDGATPSLIYGRCRVRSPLLAWCGQPTATLLSDEQFKYAMDFFMVLGIPFETPANVAVWKIWVGEGYLGATTAQPKRHSATYGQHIVDNSVDPTLTQRGAIGNGLEVFDGRPTQQLADQTAPYATTSVVGQRMVTAGLLPEQLPGYRGYVSAFHYGTGGTKWMLGNGAELGSYQYEVSSYPGDSDAFDIGLEANPAKVLIDLLTGRFGKLGFPASKIHGASFGAAKIRLNEEGNGYSRAIDSTVDLAEIIREILEQIDGVLYEDPRDGLIHLKLIRPDYDVAALPHLTTSNCQALESFAAGGWEAAVNKVRVVFTNRADDYRDGSATAQNQAAAAAQDGEVHEEIIHMPGVCTAALAGTIAARELAARSRPIAKCRAIVGRDFSSVMPGDAVKLTWPEYGIDGRVFRVAAVNRGSLANRKISLDLIEDFFFTWRATPQTANPLEPFPPFEQA